MPTVNLLAIGNELLNGEVRDKNLFTLSRALTRLGFGVVRAVVVRDTPDPIAAALNFALTPPPDVLFCCGGLGPTEDDLTLAALAQALGRPLALHPEAQALVERHYDRLLALGQLDHRGPAAARRKMATLPQGAQPLPNPVGTAPGVKVQHDATGIYVLPGVPSELEGILTESVIPELKARFDLGAWAQEALVVHCEDEAEIAQPLREVVHRHPAVYLKSLAKPFPEASAEGLRVIATTTAEDAGTAQQAVHEALADLRDTLESAGFRVSEPA